MPYQLLATSTPRWISQALLLGALLLLASASRPPHHAATHATAPATLR